MTSYRWSTVTSCEAKWNHSGCGSKLVYKKFTLRRSIQVSLDCVLQQHAGSRDVETTVQAHRVYHSLLIWHNGYKCLQGFSVPFPCAVICTLACSQSILCWSSRFTETFLLFHFTSYLSPIQIQPQFSHLSLLLRTMAGLHLAM